MTFFCDLVEVHIFKVAYSCVMIRHKMCRVCCDSQLNVIRLVDREEAETGRTRVDREPLRCAEYVPWITGFIWAVCYYRSGFITIIRDGMQVRVFTPSLISG